MCVEGRKEKKEEAPVRAKGKREEEKKGKEREKGTFFKRGILAFFFITLEEFGLSFLFS